LSRTPHSPTAVDLFCGAGGSSTGAAQTGVKILAAANHWARAIETHRHNHPQAKHYCQDASTLDPSTLPPHDILLASPACQGHAKARGKDRPHHDASRATAWNVIDVAEVTRPRWIVVENVPEFRKWQLFQEWHNSLCKLGYHLTENVLDAADFGVPQNRVRLLIVGCRVQKPAPVVPRKSRQAAAIGDAIDLHAGRWSHVAGHVEKTMARIENGRRSFGRQFVIPYYGSSTGGRSLDRPIGTITTRDRWAVVDGDRMRMLSVDECRRAMGFPDDYVLTGNRREQVHQLGNAVVPGVMRAVCESILGA